MKRLIITAFAIFIHHTLLSQYANLEFVENKGQWSDAVKYKGDLGNGAFFLQENGFRVLLHHPEDVQQFSDFYHGVKHDHQSTSNLQPPTFNLKPPTPSLLRSHSYDVRFQNAQTPLIIPGKPLNTYNNYFIGSDPQKWRGNCHIFQAVTYKNLYDKIDVHYYTSEGRLKYDIIANPGADIAAISMKYDGVDGLEVRDGNLIIKTSVGEQQELSPYAYQVINNVKKEVRCRFKVIDKTVYFVIEDHSPSSILIIDPTLIFSTFTGSSVDNWGYTATYGPDGSFYAGGIVFGSGFPTSTGAYSQTYNGGGADEEGLGGYDIGIMKFNPNGSQRVYATYLGGNGNEQPHSFVVDQQSNLVVAGRTNSGNFPTKNGGLIGAGGGFDIILTKFNSAGSDVIGSRKIGGAGRDGVNIRPKYASPTGVETIRRNYGDDARSEVILDNAGNILLASNTQSVSTVPAERFPVTAGVLQGSPGGLQDAVILKLSADLSTLIFSTFLGGSGVDAAFVLALNPLDNNIYIGGNTVSTDFPGNKTNVLYPSFQGGQTDGFVSVITANGSTLLKTSYIGTGGNDMLYGIQFDKFGFPYIMGTTTAQWPISNAAFSQPNGKQFLAKLKPDLSGYVYSTSFGTNQAAPNISPIAFLVDRCENVYVSGWGGQVNTKAGYPTSGTAGLPTTPDAIQRNTDNSDFYFFVLERNAASQLYGSFFGQSGGFGEHVDGGTSRFDRNGVIYQAMCANCGRDVNFPTTPGVWAPKNGSPECNLAAVKIAFNLAGVAGSIRASIQGVINDTTGCVPLTVNFTDTLNEGKRYVWNFGDGSGDIITTGATLSHTFNAVGTYRVRLTSIDSAKCNVADTAYVTIRVKTDKGLLNFTSKKLPPCNAFNYEFNNTTTVSPAGRPFANNSFKWYFGDGSGPVTAGTGIVNHSFPGPGVYRVTLVLTDTNFCNAPDSVFAILRIATDLNAQFNTPPAGCAPYTAVFENVSAGGQQFFWDFGDGTTSTESSPVHLYTTPGTYIVRMRAIDSSTCNKEDSTLPFTLLVSDKPNAFFTYSPNPPQENTVVNFFNATTGAASFKWLFGDGEFAEVNGLQPVSHIYNETKLFNACLVAVNPTGCPDTTCKPLQARVAPLLDVPSAFTPNGDGINDRITVRGFGITKMVWRIYNRWGAMIFETSDRHFGWDGTYKGVLQPAEVYHYVLNVRYSDGKEYQKTGDITLLR